MSKIAVYITGELRHAKGNCQLLHDRIINPLGADVYCHTWSNPKSDRVDCSLAEFIELYKPKALLVEPTHPYEKSMQHMFHSWRAVAHILKPSKYDYTVRLRTDMVPEMTLSIGDIAAKLAKCDILIPTGNDWLGGVNDQFAIIKLDQFQFDHYHSMPLVYSTNHEFPNPENVLKKVLLDNEKKIGRWDFPYTLNTNNYARIDQTVNGELL